MWYVVLILQQKLKVFSTLILPILIDCAVIKLRMLDKLAALLARETSQWLFTNASRFVKPAPGVKGHDSMAGWFNEIGSN